MPGSRFEVDHLFVKYLTKPAFSPSQILDFGVRQNDKQENSTFAGDL